MTAFIIGALVIIGIIVFIISSVSTPPAKPTAKSKENLVEKYNLKKDEEVKLWPKPHTNQVHVYAKGTAGGKGLLYVFEDKSLHKKVIAGEVYGKITSVSQNDFNIQIFPINE